MKILQNTLRHSDHSLRAQKSRSLGSLNFPLTRMGEQVRFLISAILFGGCLVLGGGGGGFADSLLQILSLLVILIAVWRCITLPALPDIPLLIVFAGILLLAAIQITPLSPSVWQHLNGRAELLQQMAAVGTRPSWYSLTLSPTATERALFWTLPGVAMYLSSFTMTTQARARLVVMLLLVAAFSLLLGVGQIGSGPDSLLSFYGNGTISYAIGFFSNRNHFACMLAMAIPLAVGLLISKLIEQRSTHVISKPWLAFLLVVIVSILIALPLTGSRAGIVLGALAVFGSLGLLLRARMGRRIVLVAMTIGVVILFVGLLLGIDQLLPRLQQDPASEARWTIHATTLVAAHHFGPLGSGLGTFVAAYQAVAPERDILPQYINHAHSDYHELWLETGWLGVVLIGVFLLWYFWRSWQVWRRSEVPSMALNLARAASVSIAVVLAHSWVDYPLRKSAIIALLGLCCALLSRNVKVAAPDTASFQASAGPERDDRPRIDKSKGAF